MTDKPKLSDDQLLQEIRIAEIERDAFFKIATGFTELAYTVQGLIGYSGYDLSSNFYMDKAKSREEKLKLLNTIKQERGL